MGALAREEMKRACEHAIDRTAASGVKAIRTLRDQLGEDARQTAVHKVHAGEGAWQGAGMWRGFICAVCAFASVACGDDGSSSKGRLRSNPDDHSTFDVSWAATTQVISEAEGKELLRGDRPSSRTLVYHFAPGASAIRALQPGQVAVLSGIAYRKVVAVRELDDEIVLETERTTLPEAIAEGTIEWSKQVNFTAPEIEASEVSMGEKHIRAVAQRLDHAISYEGEISGYKVELTLTPSDQRLDISAAVTKEILGEERLAVRGTGFIRAFRSEGRIVLNDERLATFELGQRQVEGELNVKAVAINTGASQELLDIPIGVDIPVQIGPVPMMVKVTANINVTVEVGIQDSSAEAEATFKFRSDQGVSLAGASLRSTGALATGDISGFLGGSADHVTAGMNACLEFPRIELGMLGEIASIGMTQNNCASSVYTFEPPCNEVNGAITGVALGNIGFFGVTLASTRLQIYQRRLGHQSGRCAAQ